VFVANLEQTLTGGAFEPAGTTLNAILTGKLMRTVNGWEVQDGVFTGRWTVSEVLRVLSYMIDSAAGQALCADSASFQTTKARFCPLADVRAAGDDPSLPCDGVTFAYMFTAFPAELGELIEPLPMRSGCTPENDPTTHSCGTP
jgi:hypothetical protein